MNYKYLNNQNVVLVQYVYVTVYLQVIQYGNLLGDNRTVGTVVLYLSDLA